METLPCPIYTHAIQSPERIALITDQRSWTYAELDRQIHALCHFLENTGVTQNQRIAFIAQINPATILLFFALFRMRAIACPLSPKLPQGALKEQIAQLKAHHVVEPSLLPPDRPQLPSTGALLYKNDLATFLFTSGSSGAPKIACHSFANHYENAITAIPLLHLTPHSRWLLSLPLYHVSGIGILFRCFFSGASIVISERPLPEAIAHHAISHLSLVPTQLYRLLKEPTASIAKMQQSLHCMLLGGAPIPTPLVETANQHSLPIYTTYGMTEMSSIITLSEKGAVGHSGKLLPSRTLKLEGEEVLVGGDTLFQGYWDSPTETVIPPYKEGWFSTRDLGKIKSENLEITGRIDRQFISGGENVHPEEIEDALLRIPGIRMACVVPIPDAEFGERPVAFIDDETHAHTLETIRTALKDRLPAFKHPVRILPYPSDAGIKPNLSILKQYLSQRSPLKRLG